jgi:hypothetical protein
MTAGSSEGVVDALVVLKPMPLRISSSCQSGIPFLLVSSIEVFRTCSVAPGAGAIDPDERA